MHLLPCPSCEHSIPVSPSQAGDNTLCSACGATIAIPKLGELRQLPLSPDSEPISSDEGASGGGGIGVVLLGMIAMIALLVTGFALIQCYLIEVPTTTDAHVKELRAAYETLDAARFIREYENMEEFRLEVPRMMLYKVAALDRQRWILYALIAGSVALLSLLAAYVLASRGRTQKSA